MVNSSVSLLFVGLAFLQRSPQLCSALPRLYSMELLSRIFESKSLYDFSKARTVSTIDSHVHGHPVAKSYSADSEPQPPPKLSNQNHPEIHSPSLNSRMQRSMSQSSQNRWELLGEQTRRAMDDRGFQGNCLVINFGTPTNEPSRGACSYVP